MTNCKVSIIYDDDIKTFYGQITSEKPLTLKIPGLTSELVEGALNCTLEWHSSGSFNKVSAKFSHQTANGLTVFDEVKKISGAKPPEYHIVEYKEPLIVKRIPKDEIPEYRRMSERINNTHRQNLTHKIKTILPNESIPTQYMFKMLMQIDAKMDMILDAVTEHEVTEGSVRTRGLFISGGAVGFFTDEVFAKGETIFLETAKGSSGLKFAGVAEIRSAVRTQKGYIVESVFTEIPEYARESIIKMVFERDRELLKGAKS